MLSRTVILGNVLSRIIRRLSGGISLDTPLSLIILAYPAGYPWIRFTGVAYPVQVFVYPALS